MGGFQGRSLKINNKNHKPPTGTFRVVALKLWPVSESPAGPVKTHVHYG